MSNISHPEQLYFQWNHWTELSQKQLENENTEHEQNQMVEKGGRRDKLVKSTPSSRLTEQLKKHLSSVRMKKTSEGIIEVKWS